MPFISSFYPYIATVVKLTLIKVIKELNKEVLGQNKKKMK